MKKILSYFFVASAFATSGAFAQITNNVDVSNSTFAPLYDCSIYNFSDDRGNCMQVKRELGNTSFDRQGYAVNCYEAGLGRRTREVCLDLADRVVSNSHTIDCAPLYSDRYALRQCEVTKAGYENGRFSSPAPFYQAPAPMPVPAPVVSVSRASSQYDDLCGPAAYTANMNRWMTEKEKLEKRGKKRAIIGGGLVLGGAIFGALTNSNAGRVVGGVAEIGGAVLLTLGLVDIVDAGLSMPNQNPYCRDYYVPQYRMVTYDRQECHTTQWTERGYGYSRSYYEIHCQNKTYVSYEPNFSAWDSGRQVNYYYSERRY